MKMRIKSTYAATRTTKNVSIMRMVIFTHLLRLPREGREAGDNKIIYCESAAFTVNYNRFLLIAGAVLMALLLLTACGGSAVTEVPEVKAAEDVNSYIRSVTDPDKAVQELKKSIAEYEGDDAGLALLNVKLGYIYGMNGEWVRCRDTLELGLSLDPTIAEGWRMLARACYKLDEYSGGAEAMGQFCQLGQPEYEDWEMLAEMHFELGDFPGAAEACTMALECEGCDELKMLTMRSKAEFRNGNYCAVCEDAAGCISLGGDYEENMTMIASAYECLGDKSGLLSALLDMIDRGFESNVIYENALSCAVETENYAAQEKLILRLLKYELSEEDELSLRASLAKAQLQQKKYEEAEKNLNLCLKKKKSDALMLFQRGVCRINMGDYDNSYNDFGKVLDAGEYEDECHYYMAVCMIGKGFYVTAENELKQIIYRNEDPDMVALAHKLLDKIKG